MSASFEEQRAALLVCKNAGDISVAEYASAIAELAESPEDLSEIEEEDVDALLREEHVPKLKARRFRRALRELGANVNAQ